MKILVPIDFSLGSRAILVYAIALAKSLAGTITLLRVFESPSEMSGIVPGSDDENDDRADESHAERRLQSLIASVDAHEVVIDTDVREGSPIEAIVRRATDGKFDLIVMGTHGRRAAKITMPSHDLALARIEGRVMGLVSTTRSRCLPPLEKWRPRSQGES
jgi:nucleotide-binding universal stress UspA family protein